MEELHMKLNPKVYNQLKAEPFETQELNGRIVEFHYMNDTPFLFQFASRGRFAVWTSDGANYKVLVEKKYFEAMRAFYTEEVNVIWLGFLQRVSGISRKINNFFMIPTLVLYVVIAALATWLLPNNMLEILLFMIVLVVASNMVQSRIVNKKVREENKRAQDDIRAFIGAENFEELIKAQEEHYQEYFKFEEPVEENSETIEENTDVEAESNIDEESEEKDGPESN
jgi:hypothetical protein